MSAAPPRTLEHIQEEARVHDRLASILARLIRWYASEAPDGELAELLRTWEDAGATYGRYRGHERSESGGTVLGWFLGAASQELRRGIRRAAGNPPEDEPASAWVGGRLVVALPLAPEHDPNKSFLIVEPPSRRDRNPHPEHRG